MTLIQLGREESCWPEAGHHWQGADDHIPRSEEPVRCSTGSGIGIGIDIDIGIGIGIGIGIDPGF